MVISRKLLWFAIGIIKLKRQRADNTTLQPDLQYSLRLRKVAILAFLAVQVKFKHVAHSLATALPAAPMLKIRGIPCPYN
jgi:hypothetical protein